MKWERMVDRSELLVVRVAPWRNSFVTLWCLFMLILCVAFAPQIPAEEFPGAWPLWLFSGMAVVLLPWNLWGRRELRLSREGLEVVATLFGLRRATRFPLPESVHAKECRGAKGARYWALLLDGKRQINLRMPEADTDALAKELHERAVRLRGEIGPYR